MGDIFQMKEACSSDVVDVVLRSRDLGKFQGAKRESDLDIIIIITSVR